MLVSGHRLVLVLSDPMCLLCLVEKWIIPGGRSQDAGIAWKFFVCLMSMRYHQTNSKLSYTPRKLTGGLTQQSSQPAPQNSAGTRHREVNWGERSRGGQGAAFACGERMEMAGAGGRGDGDNMEKAPPPQKKLERKW